MKEYSEMKAELISILEDLDTEELVKVHNQYCEECNYMDDYIYGMECLDEFFGDGMTAYDIIDSLGSNFNIRDDYFYNTIYGINSFNFLPDGDAPVYISDIAEWMLDNMEDCGISDVKELFEEMEEEEEDEDEEE